MSLAIHFIRLPRQRSIRFTKDMPRDSVCPEPHRICPSVHQVAAKEIVVRADIIPERCPDPDSTGAAYVPWNAAEGHRFLAFRKRENE